MSIKTPVRMSQAPPTQESDDEDFQDCVDAFGTPQRKNLSYAEKKPDAYDDDDAYDDNDDDSEIIFNMNKTNQSIIHAVDNNQVVGNDTDVEQAQGEVEGMTGSGSSSPEKPEPVVTDSGSQGDTTTGEATRTDIVAESELGEVSVVPDRSNEREGEGSQDSCQDSALPSEATEPADDEVASSHVLEDTAEKPRVEPQPSIPEAPAEEPHISVTETAAAAATTGKDWSAEHTTSGEPRANTGDSSEVKALSPTSQPGSILPPSSEMFDFDSFADYSKLSRPATTENNAGSMEGNRSAPQEDQPAQPSQLVALPDLLDPLSDVAQSSGGSQEAHPTDVQMRRSPQQNLPDTLIPSPTEGRTPTPSAVPMEEGLEESDPFQPKATLMNSPKAANMVELDPFKPSKGLANSPLREEDFDPFKPKAALVNSPLQTSVANQSPPPPLLPTQVHDSLDPCGQVGTSANSPTPQTLAKMEGQTPASPVMPTHDILADLDPFKPKKALATSPPLVARLVESESADGGSSRLEPTVTVSEDAGDPFKPKVSLTNSPAQEIPAKPNLGDGTSVQAQNFITTQLEENLDSIDPFKPKAALANSPPPASSSNFDLDSIDPFKPKAVLANSPPPASLGKEASDDDSSKQPQNAAAVPLGVDFDTINPFKPKAALANSPPPASSGKEALDDDSSKHPQNPAAVPLVEDFDAIDPFKPKAALANSPPPVSSTKKDSDDGTSKQPQNAAALPVEENAVDPFKPKAALANSPVPVNPAKTDGDINPFQPTKTLVSSPTKEANLDMDDPFKPRAALANYPIPVGPDITEVDPFKPSKTLMNSPLTEGNADAVATVKSSEILPDLPAGSQDAADPFKPKSSLLNSPPKSETKTRLPQPEAGRASVPNTTENDENKAPDNNAPKSTQKKPGQAKSSLRRPRFRAPPNFGKKPSDSGDDIQIFVPGQKPPATPQPKAPDSGGEDIQIFVPGPQKPKMAPPAGVTAIEDSVPAQPAPNVPKMDCPSGECLMDELPVTVSPVVERPPEPGDSQASNVPSSQTEAEDLLNIQDEEFVSAAEFLNDSASWQFLNQCVNEVEDNPAIARESLYVKFDPLVKRSGPFHPALADMSSNQAKNLMRQSIYMKRNGQQVPAGPVSPAVHRDVSRLRPPQNSTPAKRSTGADLISVNTPTQPAEVEALSTTTPVSSTQRHDEPPAKPDLFALSPASTDSELIACPTPRPGRILPDGGENIVKELKYTQADVDQMICNCELRIQADMLNKHRVWTEQVEELTAERLKLHEALQELQDSNEMLFCELNERDKKTQQAIKEKEQIEEDLKSFEASFNDLYKRYEKARDAVNSYQKSEKQLKENIAALQEKYKEKVEKFAGIGETYNKTLDEYSAKIAQSEAIIRKQELQIKSLENITEQKTTENKELMAICDELISKASK